MEAAENKNNILKIISLNRKHEYPELYYVQPQNL